MKTTKKSWLMVIAFALMISGIASLVAPKEAEASGLFAKRSGYFSNYVETQAYMPNYSSNVKQMALLSGSITTNSTAKGSFTMYIQTRTISGAWLTVKTVKVNKNGTTKFSTPKFSPKNGYRFKLVNEGTKSKVNYSMSWLPFAY